MIPWINLPRSFPVRSTAPLVDQTQATWLYLVKTADYTVNVNDVVILANGNLTITLPAEHDRHGHRVIIKNIGAGTVVVYREPAS